MNTALPEPLRYIDLFAGIGGIRMGFVEAARAMEHPLAVSCAMTAEWDKHARTTYAAFMKHLRETQTHPDGSSPYADAADHVDLSDINAAFEHTGVDYADEALLQAGPTAVPSHDVLLAGFPCQPFSLAGVSKKNSLGRKHGFEDVRQGNLFFRIRNILRERKPRLFILENVKNLQSHDKGRTWKTIRQELENVGYVFTAKVIDAKVAVPQHRERIFIVGVRRDAPEATGGFLAPTGSARTFWDTVDKHLVPSQAPTFASVMEKDVGPEYCLTEHLVVYLHRYAEKHRAAGNGFGFSEVNASTKYTRTISARYHKDGSEALVALGARFERSVAHENSWPEGVPKFRRLTPLECLRLQGFPRGLEQFYAPDSSTAAPGRARRRNARQPVSDTQAYRQFGNSVAVPVVTAVARALFEFHGQFERWARTQSIQLSLPNPSTATAQAGA